MPGPSGARVQRAGVRPRWQHGAWLALLALPWLLMHPWVTVAQRLPVDIDRQLLSIMIFALLALGLHVQLGLAGIMQLGIAAPFALGAFATGILTVEKYPFQLGFWAALLLVPPIIAALGALLGLPAVLLRGDYVAMVTLGAAEVVRVVLLNAEAITDGSRGLNPLPPPSLPGVHGSEAPFLIIYATTLVLLTFVVGALGRLERRPFGLALAALRADPLALCALGYSPARLRLGAMALGAGIAGIAGVLYATYLTTTAEPNSYDFNVSVMVLCSVVVGGTGSRAGAVLGAALLVGLDNLLLPLVGHLVAPLAAGQDSVWLTLSNWRWLLFGGALLATMRLKPRGLCPERRHV